MCITAACTPYVQFYSRASWPRRIALFSTIMRMYVLLSRGSRREGGRTRARPQRHDCPVAFTGFNNLRSPLVATRSREFRKCQFSSERRARDFPVFTREMHESSRFRCRSTNSTDHTRVRRRWRGAKRAVDARVSRFRALASLQGPR